MKQAIPKQTLQRLPLYLNHCASLPTDGSENISATAIADALGLNPVQVRKDLAMVSSAGRPKVGYQTKDLIAQLRAALGYDNTNRAVIVGAGKLGRALLGYGGFAAYGLDIVAAFDVDETLMDTTVGSVCILPLHRMRDLCQRLGTPIGIITVPATVAQSICDTMVACGILAIWNFAPVHLHVPEDILVHNENMAASLAVLSNHLADKLHGR